MTSLRVIVHAMILGRVESYYFHIVTIVYRTVVFHNISDLVTYFGIRCSRIINLLLLQVLVEFNLQSKFREGELT